MQTDILYPCWNRLEYTRFSLGMLIRNTPWPLVRSLVIYDDESSDGTSEFLRSATQRVPAQVEYRREKHGSPVSIMNAYLERASGDVDLVAKIDNDIVVPAGWLEASLQVLEDRPELELLGLAAGWTGADHVAGERYGYEACSHIGGVGVMRLSAFRSRPAMNANGRFGFTSWQEKHEPVRGWITPDVQATQLDLVPIEPWSSLAADYVRGSLQREWPPYSPASHRFWDGWPTAAELWPA